MEETSLFLGGCPKCEVYIGGGIERFKRCRKLESELKNTENADHVIKTMYPEMLPLRRMAKTRVVELLMTSIISQSDIADQLFERILDATRYIQQKEYEHFIVGVPKSESPDFYSSLVIGNYDLSVTRGMLCRPEQTLTFLRDFLDFAGFTEFSALPAAPVIDINITDFVPGSDNLKYFQNAEKQICDQIDKVEAFYMELVKLLESGPFHIKTKLV